MCDLEVSGAISDVNICYYFLLKMEYVLYLNIASYSFQCKPYCIPLFWYDSQFTFQFRLFLRIEPNEASRWLLSHNQVRWSNNY